MKNGLSEKRRGRGEIQQEKTRTHYEDLRRLLGTHKFEPFVVDHLTDQRGRYSLALNPSFPLAVKLFSFAEPKFAFRLNWHERLEIFIPVCEEEGEACFRIGERIVNVAGGELLIVDNLKMHGLIDFRGRERQAITLTFMPELIYSLGSPPCDYFYLAPFYCRTEDASPVVGREAPEAKPIYEALINMLDCYFRAIDGPQFQAGCKVFLLEILYRLTRHFRWSEVAHSEYLRQQERSQRLGRLLDHISQNYEGKMSVEHAAGMVNLSESRFMKFFKQATGMTFITYLNHVRLTQAARLLRESDDSIADVAMQVGFTDQSYFDRKFKQHFGRTPRSMRSGKESIEKVSPATELSK